jgi:cytochrome c553
MGMKRAILFLVVVLSTSPGLCASPEELLLAYAAKAGQADSGFIGFSADRGKAFYFSGHRLEDGSELSCSSCHHEDPRREQFAHHDKIPCRACHGMPETGSFEDIPKIRRQFLPLAPSANSRRFTDEWLVEKWFRKNCGLLLKRDCTPVEKGDVIIWLLTLQ